MLTGKKYPKEEFSSIVVQLGFGGEDVPLDDKLTFEQEGALGHDKVARFDELNTWTQSGTSRMVRMGDWKLVMNSYGRGELYNLKKDPYEINNLFGNSKFVNKQNELLTNWWLGNCVCRIHCHCPDIVIISNGILIIIHFPSDS